MPIKLLQCQLLFLLPVYSTPSCWWLKIVIRSILFNPFKNRLYQNRSNLQENRGLQTEWWGRQMNKNPQGKLRNLTPGVVGYPEIPFAVRTGLLARVGRGFPYLNI